MQKEFADTDRDIIIVEPNGEASNFSAKSFYIARSTQSPHARGLVCMKPCSAGHS